MSGNAFTSLTSAALISLSILGSAYIVTHPNLTVPTISSIVPTAASKAEVPVSKASQLAKNASAVLSKRAGAIIMGAIVTVGLGLGVVSYRRKRSSIPKPPRK
ncbi:uncharacterized protein SPPG_04713 [Spizellomyces punctatus DAOM BR117]|uniref:Transmembrane protein n=1 Tax=Spizellomyces punctatus (strain DAOM BR117) TaxID=645134 RepID=A0A0L0HHP8_SPIPD|nr:uncharacterized protein SPPG_04713 [Spizellomyces punctatus DAOM BR117]KND00390.1 hypothetical protein SPPG_04713 [Spizellomyces punctatus DAOM BR117]|eukprot:XP_016608429.1 hypothetical protein SPPG_04713 [Spizellomyces punctatus DAOM BR117]